MPVLRVWPPFGDGEVVLELGLVFDAVDDGEGGFAEVGEAGDVDGGAVAAGGVAVGEADGVAGELVAGVVDLVGAEEGGVLDEDGPVVEALAGGAGCRSFRRGSGWRRTPGCR